MPQSSRPWSRRTFLRGAGALMALPWMESLAPRVARGATAGPPVRMGIFTVTGGTVLESWKPAEEGKLGKLPSILRPLEPWKKDLLVLSGLSHNGKSEGGLNGHEQCAFLHLTGAPVVKKVDGKVIAGVSVDQAAAQAVGDQTYLSSLEIGYTNHETRYSFRSPDQIAPVEADPRLAFERMFRGREPMAPNWQKKTASDSREVRATSHGDSAERSVLDLVREEAQRLQVRLGVDDRRKLDEYLESVRSLERRIDFLEQEAVDRRMSRVGAAKVDPPQELAEGLFNFAALRGEIEHDPEPHGRYIDVMTDLMALAFQTDTTRVCTLAVGSDGAMFPGVVTVGYERHAHTLEHTGNARRVEDADPIAREGCRQIHAWYTDRFARLLDRLSTIQEAGAPLLDNCMLLYTSYMADGGHGRRDYPALLAGSAGGQLTTGRHIAYGVGTPASNLYVEMLHRMSVPVPSFGDSLISDSASYSGRLPGLSV